MREAPCDGSSHSFLTQPTVDMNTGVIRCGQHRLHWKFRFLGVLESCNETLEPFPAERIKNASTDSFAAKASINAQKIPKRSKWALKLKPGPLCSVPLTSLANQLPTS